MKKLLNWSSNFILLGCSTEIRNEKASLDKLVEKFVEFNPTIICFELEPKNNGYIDLTYS